jgi:hypothetical protein
MIGPTGTVMRFARANIENVAHDRKIDRRIIVSCEIGKLRGGEEDFGNG